MDCRCDTVTELYGREAENYAYEHLHRDDTSTERFVEGFSCPDTGTRWLLEYPERTERELGQARLRAEPG